MKLPKCKKNTLPHIYRYWKYQLMHWFIVIPCFQPFLFMSIKLPNECVIYFYQKKKIPRILAYKVSFNHKKQLVAERFSLCKVAIHIKESMKFLVFILMALASTLTVSCLQCYDCGSPIADLLSAVKCLNRNSTCEGGNTTCISRSLIGLWMIFLLKKI